MKKNTLNNKRKIYVAIGIFLVIALSMQCFVSKVPNPPVTGDFQGPAEISSILRQACYDCHSNETNLPWYAYAAPASWVVADDVKEGRKRLNFSHWDSLSNGEQTAIMWNVVNMIGNKRMPLPAYLKLHPSAAVSDTALSILKRYVVSTYSKPLPSYMPDAAEDSISNELQAGIPPTLPVSLNGVKYVTGYQKWQVVSTTNRFDNNSIRVIYGNDIAAKAIKENQIKPWPAGSTLVKVVWDSELDAAGTVHSGALNSVQIMVKDQQRFPTTEGWGFAKFNGPGLKPFGKTAAFQQACINCHQQASDYGFVFNLPAGKKISTLNN